MSALANFANIGKVFVQLLQALLGVLTQSFGNLEMLSFHGDGDGHGLNVLSRAAARRCERYFRTSDVDALWAQLKDRCRVEYAPATFDYGMREFAVYDNSGYLLQFGQEVS